MPKINNRKLKAIGYLDFIFTCCTVGLVFFMVIGSFYSAQEKNKQLELSTELQPVKKVGRGYLGFSLSTMFLFFVGIYAVLSACMLIQASNLQKRERNWQYLLVQYWLNNAFDVLIVMSMAWFFILGESIFNDDCKAIFTTAAIQVPYLVFYSVKVVFLVLVWKEYQKFTAEDMGLKDKNWETWQALLGFEVGPTEDIESGGSSAQEAIGGKHRMTGKRGRRNRQRARRNQPKITRLGSDEV